MKSGFLKWVACLTLQAFILSSLFFTSPAEIFAQEFPVSVLLKFPETYLQFPAELGKFETFSLPQGSSDKPFIYVVQDAHGSLAVQENIFKILTFLKQKGQLDLLLLEGAAGPLTAERLNPFKEEARDKRFLEALSHQGLVNGAVKFFGTTSRVNAFGMEDPALYRQNLETYRFVLRRRDAVQNFLNRGEVSLMESTRKILDPKVLLFLKRWKIQQEKGEDFGEYLRFLLDYAARSLKIDWHDYALQQDWPQLVRIFHLLNTDLKRDYPKLEKEIKLLRRSLGEEASPEMEWLQRTVEVDSISSHDFRDTVTSPRRMAERLVEKAQARNIPWVRYPTLTQFLSFQIFKNEIVPEDLFNEIQTLERKIFESLSRDPNAGAWMGFYQDFYLLKQALSLELRREQIARFRGHFKGNWMKAFKRFLGNGDLPQEKVVAPLVGKILEFYAQAEARENAFLSSLSRKLPEGGVSFPAQGGPSAVKYLVIVTGGYHKEGLKQKIDLFHIPYGVITPRLEVGENLLPYQKIMMGDYAEVATLAPAQIPVMRDPSVAERMIGSRAFSNFQAVFQRIQNVGILAERPSSAPSSARSEVRASFGRRAFTGMLLGSLVFGPSYASAQIKILQKGRDKAREEIKSDRNFVLPDRNEPLPPAVVVDEYSLASKLLANDPVVQKAHYEVTIQQAGKGRLAKSISISPSFGIVDGKPLLGLKVDAVFPNVGSIGMGGYAIGNAATVVMDFATVLSNYLKGKDIFAKEMAEQMIEIARFDQQEILGERYLYYLKLAYEIKTLDEQIPVAEKVCQSLDHALEVSLKNRQTTEEKRQALRDLKSAWLLRLNTFQSSSKKDKAELLNLYAPGAIGETKFMLFINNTELPDGWGVPPGMEAALRIKATQKSGAEFPANRALARSYAARLAAVTAARVAGIKDGFTFGLGGFNFADPYGSNPPDNFHTLVEHDLEERDHNQRAISSNGNLTIGGKANADKNVAILKVSVADAELQVVKDRISMRVSDLLRSMEESLNAIKVLQEHNRQLDDFIRRASSQGALTEDRTVTQAVEIEENNIKIFSAKQAISMAVQEILVLTWDFKGGLPKPLDGGRSEMRSSFGGEKDVMAFAATSAMGIPAFFASRIAPLLGTRFSPARSELRNAISVKPVHSFKSLLRSPKFWIVSILIGIGFVSGFAFLTPAVAAILTLSGIAKASAAFALFMSPFVVVALYTAIINAANNLLDELFGWVARFSPSHVKTVARIVLEGKGTVEDAAAVGSPNLWSSRNALIAYFTIRQVTSVSFGKKDWEQVSRWDLLKAARMNHISEQNRLKIAVRDEVSEHMHANGFNLMKHIKEEIKKRGGKGISARITGAVAGAWRSVSEKGKWGEKFWLVSLWLTVKAVFIGLPAELMWSFYMSFIYPGFYLLNRGNSLLPQAINVSTANKAADLVRKSPASTGILRAVADAGMDTVWNRNLLLKGQLEFMAKRVYMMAAGILTGVLSGAVFAAAGVHLSVALFLLNPPLAIGLVLVGLLGTAITAFFMSAPKAFMQEQKKIILNKAAMELNARGLGLREEEAKALMALLQVSYSGKSGPKGVDFEKIQAAALEILERRPNAQEVISRYLGAAIRNNYLNNEDSLESSVLMDRFVPTNAQEGYRPNPVSKLWAVGGIWGFMAMSTLGSGREAVAMTLSSLDFWAGVSQLAFSMYAIVPIEVHLMVSVGHTLDTGVNFVADHTGVKGFYAEHLMPAQNQSIVDATSHATGAEQKIIAATTAMKSENGVIGLHELPILDFLKSHETWMKIHQLEATDPSGASAADFVQHGITEAASHLRFFGDGINLVEVYGMGLGQDVKGAVQGSRDQHAVELAGIERQAMVLLAQREARGQVTETAGVVLPTSAAAVKAAEEKATGGVGEHITRWRHAFADKFTPPARQGQRTNLNDMPVMHAGFDAPITWLVKEVSEALAPQQIKVVPEAKPVAAPQDQTPPKQLQRRAPPIERQRKVAAPQPLKTVTNPKATVQEPSPAPEQPNAKGTEPTAEEAAMDAEYKIGLAALVKEVTDNIRNENEQREAETVHFDSLEDALTNTRKWDAVWFRNAGPLDERVSKELGRPAHVDEQGFVHYLDEKPTGPVGEGEQKQKDGATDGQSPENGSILANPFLANPFLTNPLFFDFVPGTGLLPGVGQSESDRGAPKSVIAVPTVDQGQLGQPSNLTPGSQFGLQSRTIVAEVPAAEQDESDRSVPQKRPEGEDLSKKSVMDILTGWQGQRTREEQPPVEDRLKKAVTGIPVAGQGERDRGISQKKPEGEDLSKKTVMDILTGGQGQRTREEQLPVEDLSKRTVTEILETGQKRVERGSDIPPKKQAGEDTATVAAPLPDQGRVPLAQHRPARNAVSKSRLNSSRTSEETSRGPAPKPVLSRGVTLYAGSGQAIVNPSGAITLKVPFTADNMAYAVKPGDIVKKGDLLVRASDTERENRMRFLENRIQEINGQIADGKENPGTLDRDTLLQYQFTRTEFELELFRFRAEQEADALYSPRPALVQTLPLGPATDGGYAIQIVPLDEGVIKIKLPPHYSSADDLALSVNGKQVTVLGWEASGFDLAEGPEGEFNLNIHFVSQSSVTSGNKETPAHYDIQLIKRDLRSVDPARIHKNGFHTLIPPSQLVTVGVSPVPGIGAGFFHSAVRDGQNVQAGEILGEVSIPAVHAEETQKVAELTKRANDFRRANNDFNTLPESALQDYDARASRAMAGLQRSGAPIPIRAPISGRVQGVMELDSQMLALGRMTEAGIVSDEIYLGTRIDPRSKEWSGHLSSDDPYLIPVKRGTLKRGDKVSVITPHGILTGTAYAVIPLVNNGFELFTTLDGAILKIVDSQGILGEGSAVDIAFDNGASASEWAHKGDPAPIRLAPPLTFQDDIPAALREELQIHPGKKIGTRRMLELAVSEQNVYQKFEILKYFTGAFGFRYLGWLTAVLLGGILAMALIPKLLFSFVKNRRHRNFFRRDLLESLQELRSETDKIEMSLNRRALNRNIDAAQDPDKRVVREIVEPIQAWIRLLWEHENLNSEEYATILTIAGEVTGNEFLRFSQEHFENLDEQWKNDTRYQVKIRGILARLSILSSRMAVSHLRQLSVDQKEVDYREFLKFQEQITDFAESFNEGYNLAHRLIALSQVIDLYPPKLVRSNSPLNFTEWMEIIKNRIVIWTFPIQRFFLGVSLMVIYNRHAALVSAKKVFTDTAQLNVTGFTSVEEAMKVAREGLHRAFHQEAFVDAVEGNKLEAYYGRWLGRLLVLTGVLIAIQAPLIFALFGLSAFVAQGFGLVLKLLAPTLAVWRHVGPMIIKLRGEGYGVWKDEISTLRRAAKKMNKKLPKIAAFDDSQHNARVSPTAPDSLTDETPDAATVTPEEAQTFARLVLDQIPQGMTLEEAMREPGAAQQLESFFEKVLLEAQATEDPAERAKKIGIIEQFLKGNRSEMRASEKQDWGIVATIAQRVLERNAKLMPELQGFIVQDWRKKEVSERPEPKATQTDASVPSPAINPSSEDLIMLKMREALLDDHLRESTEVVVLLPPQNGENKKFFEGMVSKDKVLQRFRFIVKESDGLFPGTAGQIFAARALAQSPERKIKVYWFPQAGVPLPVAMSLFTANLAEALRMAGDFKARGMKYGEIIFPGGDLSSNTFHYSKNGSSIVIDARLASFAEVSKRRYPVLLGRNGTPRHNVEHVVRRPEELAAALSQYGYTTKLGLTTRNTVLLQFPVPKGPFAIVSNNEEEYQRMQELLNVFLKKTEDLIGRYGAFWVDFLEDFAGVIAEFHRQLKENDSVSPSLERLVHSQKKFPDGLNTANPYGKIYKAIGETLWAYYTEQQQLPSVESFIPPPTSLLFVPGDDLQKITQQLEYIRRKCPELVNAMAFNRLKSGVIPDDEKEEFLFRYSHTGEILKLPRSMGYERKYAALVSAAFVIKDGKLLFQRRSRLANSNPGLLDLAVVEQREEGETPEATIRRGFREELFDGQPLPPSLASLSFQPLENLSYEVQHERRRQIPGTKREEASVFLVSLSGEFNLNEFVPGDAAVEVVSYSPEEVERMYIEQHGVFTPRTYAMLKEFLPRIKTSMTSPDHSPSPARSETRTAARTSRKIFLGERPISEPVVRRVVPERSPELSPQGPNLAPVVQEVSRERGPAASVEIRILTAILIAKKILAYQDRALFLKLETSLKNSAYALSRALPSLAAFLGFPASDMTVLRGRIEMLMKRAGSPRQAADDKILFLDGGILPEEYFSQLGRSEFPIVFAFDRKSREHYDRIFGKFGTTLAEKKVYIVYAPDGLSSFIKQALRPGSDYLQDSPLLYRTLSRFQSPDKAQDIVFIARDRNESKKVETHYVGHRYYYGSELLKLDPELVLYSLQLLLRSPELFKNGRGRDGQSVETFLGFMLRLILEAAQTEKRVSIAA